MSKGEGTSKVWIVQKCRLLEGFVVLNDEMNYVIGNDLRVPGSVFSRYLDIIHAQCA